MAPWAAFATLNFLSNLRVGPISSSITLHSDRKAFHGKRSSLLDPLINCEDNEVLRIWPLGLHSQHFIFFVT
jgi:hypothetical protein